MFSLQEVLSNINVVKGLKDSFGAKTFMGRVAIPIRKYFDKPGECISDWYDLGKLDWSHEDGTVRNQFGMSNSLHYFDPVSVYSVALATRFGCGI